jgi:hypothetical protein
VKPLTLKIEPRPLAGLIPFARNARTHSDLQVAQIAASIKELNVQGCGSRNHVHEWPTVAKLAEVTKEGLAPQRFWIAVVSREFLPPIYIKKGRGKNSACFGLFLRVLRGVLPVSNRLVGSGLLHPAVPRAVSQLALERAE